MNGRKLTVLTAIAGILALGEFGSAVMIGWGRLALIARGGPLPSCSAWSS
jgi:hypothetical protein